MTTSDQTRKVQNWSEYNEALVDRGRLTVWLGEETIENWKHDGPTQQGAQWIFTDLAVKTCLQIKVIYGLTLRETEGFVESIVEMMGLEKQMPVPDYTTLSKRQGDLDIEIQSSKGSLVVGESGSEEEKVHLIIDSTGLKVYGEGEWKQRIHGKQKRRTWRKLHLGVDSDTGEITAVGLTDNTSHDGSQVERLLDQTLDQTDKELSAVGGDGTCDAWDVYDAITDREATPVIPPQRNAKIAGRGNCSGPPLPRDEAIRYIRGHGRKKWKRVSGYHRRSLAETAVYRSGATDGKVRGGSQVGKRAHRSPTESEGAQQNDSAWHAGNEQDRSLSGKSQDDPPTCVSKTFVQQSRLEWISASVQYAT